MMELFLARYLYFLVLVLLVIGLYGVLAKVNLVKKVIGLTIFSTAIYLFFIEGSVREGGTTPIIDDRGSDPSLYVNPVPHLLILTAIVVGVAVVGVALALLVRLYRTYGTLDEARIAARMAEGDHGGAAGPPSPAAEGAAEPDHHAPDPGRPRSEGDA